MRFLSWRLVFVPALWGYQAGDWAHPTSTIISPNLGIYSPEIRDSNILMKKHIRYSRIKCSIKRGVSGTPCCIWLRQLSIVLCSDLSVVRGLLLGHKYPNYIIAHPIAWLMFVRPFAEFDFTDLYSIFMTCSQLMMQCSEVRPIQ